MLGRATSTSLVAARMRELMRAYAGDDTEPADGPGPGPEPVRPVPWRQRLAARFPVRLDPGRRAAMAVGVAVLAAAMVTAVWLLAQRPKAVPLPDSAPSISGAASPVGSALGAAAPVPSVPVASGPVPAQVVVDVAGEVRHPGLYRLPSGARVDDAVRRAGGPLAGVDLTSLNLAARVVDGQQILVGVAGAAGGGAPGSAPAAGSAVAVNLNAATLDDLETLPGVGPVLAQHILDWRTAHGGFASVDQLNDVPGIGAVKFGALRSLVTT